MLNIIIGIVLIIIGSTGITRNWYMFVDILGVLVPLALISFGIVALLAGIRHFKKDAQPKNS